MSDGFTDFLDRTQAFYGELAANNRKDWFEPRKERWKADIEAPAKLLSEIMAEDLSRMTGDGHSGKLFRIHRDVRFSRDKSPYKTMLALLWSSGEAGAPSFYLGVEPADVFVGCGSPGFDKKMLIRYRALVDARGDALARIIAESGAAISDFGPAPLKRVPKPYDAAHPHADLIRRKNVVLGTPLPQDWRARGLPAALTGRFEKLLPFRNFLAEHL